jgi:hypothetical protein
MNIPGDMTDNLIRTDVASGSSGPMVESSAGVGSWSAGGRPKLCAPGVASLSWSSGSQSQLNPAGLDVKEVEAHPFLSHAVPLVSPSVIRSDISWAVPNSMCLFLPADLSVKHCGLGDITVGDGSVVISHI